MNAVELALELNHCAREDLDRVTTKEGFIASAKDQNFGVFFGRDAEASSIFALDIVRKYPNNPDNKRLLRHVRNSLITMALYQGKTVDPWRDEEPGKIVHELRHDKEPKNQQRLAELKETGWPVEGPPGSYRMRAYPSVDATPVFVGVACDYLKITQDERVLRLLDQPIRNALLWMREYGDIDGDGLIEYQAKNRNTLLNQGWKDSNDSIKDENGNRPKEPIALVEVQGYQYEALMKTSVLYEDRDPDFAEKLLARAKTLKAKFNRDFWLEEGFFAYALEGDKKQIRDITSNVGHLLMSGIINREKLPQVVARLMKPDMLTPYGVRTLSSESSYFSDQEPSAYHNGCVWPHDNALIVIGLEQADFVREAETVRDAVLNAQGILKHEYAIQDTELYIVDRFGRLRPYDTAQKPQGWAVTANLDLTVAA